MLQAYRVTGRGFHVGAGVLLLVSIEQARDRMHKLEPVSGVIPRGDFGLVRAKEVQAFKAGELLALAEMPKGQLHLVEEMQPKRGAKKDDPEADFYNAVRDFNAEAEDAELRRQDAADAAEKKRLREAAAAADAIDVTSWTLEFNTITGVKEKYGKLDAYIAARRNERDQANKQA